MKFVKGDAIAGIIVLGVNVVGGLVIGGIYNGLYLLGVSSQWIDVVVAAVLLAAALVDVLSRRGAQGQA